MAILLLNYNPSASFLKSHTTCSSVYVVFRAGSRLLVIKMAGSVYLVPVSENVNAGQAQIVKYFVLILPSTSADASSDASADTSADHF